jgi:hypothetical protein
MPQESGPQRQRKRPTQKKRLLRWYLGLGVTAAALLLIVLLLPETQRPDPVITERYPESERPGGRGPGGGSPEAAPESDVGSPEAVPEGRRPGGGNDGVVPGGFARPERPEPERKGSLAIVIDDVGNSLSDLEPFLEFDGPVTFAVLPQREYSEEAARLAAEAGKEVILHLPMEPVSEMDPGPGAIRVGMSRRQIERTLWRNLKSVPGTRGVNNHMGSRATADPEVMAAVLSVLKREGLFFLDSRTSAETVGRITAEKHNLPYLERAVFLDNESNRDYIRNAVREGMQIAERKGHAVMIGHVMVNELVEVLNEMYPFIQDEGFDLRYLSELVLNPEFDEDTRS